MTIIGFHALSLLFSKNDIMFYHIQIINMKDFKIILFLSLISMALQAQMFVNSDTLYGNEWINYDQSYYKIAVVEDGFYKISYEELNTADVFSGGSPLGSNFQLFCHGKEIPIHVSQNGTFGSSDFIAFYGERNRGQLDSHIYLDPSYQTNTEYSIFTDTSYYFLTCFGFAYVDCLYP